MIDKWEHRFLEKSEWLASTLLIRTNPAQG